MTTQETIKKAVDYAKENNIKNIVVATTTGGNLTYLEDEKDLHIVGVTNVYDQGLLCTKQGTLACQTKKFGR